MIDIYEWDIRRFALQGKGQRLLRYTDYLLENITQQVFERQGLGMNVTQFKVLGNADGFNLIEHGCPLCKKKTFKKFNHPIIIIEKWFSRTVNRVMQTYCLHFMKTCKQSYYAS